MEQEKIPYVEDFSPDTGDDFVEKGFFDTKRAKYIKFGSGSNSITIDYSLGLWLGDDNFDRAPFKVSKTGVPTITSLIISNASTSLSAPPVQISSAEDGYSTIKYSKSVGGEVLEIVQAANDGNRCYGITFNITNAGAGAEYAFYFKGDEYNLTATAVATVKGVIKIYCPDGSTGYIPVYTTYS